MAPYSIEWFKSCCSVTSGQTCLRVALMCGGCLLPGAWQAPSGARLRIVMEVPGMLLEYRRLSVTCSPLCLIQRRQLSGVPKGLSNQTGSVWGREVVWAFSPVVKLNRSWLSRAQAHLCLHIAVLNNHAHGRLLKLGALCMNGI